MSRLLLLDDELLVARTARTLRSTARLRYDQQQSQQQKQAEHGNY